MKPHRYTVDEIKALHTMLWNLRYFGVDISIYEIYDWANKPRTYRDPGEDA